MNRVTRGRVESTDASTGNEGVRKMSATRHQRGARPGRGAAAASATAWAAAIVLSTGCATTAPAGSATLGHIRLVPSDAPEVAGQPFCGDSTIRRHRVVARDGACALYELEVLAGGVALPRAVLGHHPADAHASRAPSPSSWEGEPVDGEPQVERAMVYAPEPNPGDTQAADPASVRVALVFDGVGPEPRSQLPWLLECEVPASGHVGIPATLVAGAFASGRRPTACSHEACSVSELELTPMSTEPRASDGVERALLQAIHVEVRAHADASGIIASRRAALRPRVALKLDEAPPDLVRDERDRRATWEGTRTALEHTLTSVP